MKGAVAVDLGASSGRFAVGSLVDGKIVSAVIEQIPHQPSERNGRLEWDLDALLGLCRRAAEFGEQQVGECTLGIDSWGVDHGFVDAEGRLLGNPVCYRDLSHLRAFEALAPHRPRLYALTGIQHQPFNTVCQLYARQLEDPSLPSRASWMILPDLLGFLLTGERHYEMTQASTTQLQGLDGTWSAEALGIAGWPTPDLQPALPGQMGAAISDRVRLAHVGSHDTASAVAGFGAMPEGQMFLNVGTWSLAGAVLDQPRATVEAEAAGFTNERTVDGRIRFLKNIPGFYVINRLHEELGVRASVPDWLAGMTPVEERLDLLRPEFFNPDSMVETCRSLAPRVPTSDSEWAGLALLSLTHTIAQTPTALSALTGHPITSIRVGGGGSQSELFCRSLAAESGLEVVAGPAESTLLGNLAVQFLAQGAFSTLAEMEACVARSSEVVRY